MNSDLDALATIALFIEQGYSLDETIAMVTRIYPSRQIATIAATVQEGTPLDQAINEARLPRLFKEYFYFFNNGTTLARAISQAVALSRHQQEIRKSIVKKSSYPLALLGFIVIFAIFLIVSLLPQINSLFGSFGLEPSYFSRVVFMLLRWFPYLVLAVALILAVTTALAIHAIKGNSFYLIDRLVVTPGLQGIVKSYYSLKFAIYYNELLQGGYDTTNIIAILYNQINDRNLKMVVYELKKEIEQGTALEQIVSDFDYFNEFFKSCFYLMIHDNQPAKNLNLYISTQQQLIERKIDLILKLIQPLVFGFIAFFIISIYLAIIIPTMDAITII